MSLFDQILEKGRKKIAILIDPDKSHDEVVLQELIRKINLLNPAFIFIGGSTVDASSFNFCVEYVKRNATIPVILFPGSHNQIHEQADGILFLSLISGRNPDYLIGHHVEAAHLLKKMPTEVISTGYLLIDGGKNSSVQYVSQTTPIPSDQDTIAVKTAIAGEMLGMGLIFLDAGSGALRPVPVKMIREVKKNIGIPLIVGGGMRTVNQISDAFDNGADIVVIGNKIEEDIDFLLELITMTKSCI